MYPPSEGREAEGLQVPEERRQGAEQAAAPGPGFLHGDDHQLLFLVLARRRAAGNSEPPSC